MSEPVFDRVVEFVKAHPSRTRTEITKALRLQAPPVVVALAAAESAGLIERRSTMRGKWEPRWPVEVWLPVPVAEGR